MNDLVKCREIVCAAEEGGWMTEAELDPNVPLTIYIAAPGLCLLLEDIRKELEKPNFSVGLITGSIDKALSPVLQR